MDTEVTARFLVYVIAVVVSAELFPCLADMSLSV